MADIMYEDRHKNNVSEAELLKDRNKDEILAIKYFQGIPLKKGCFKTVYVSDEQYNKVMENLVGDLEKRKAHALSRLGIDEDQVQEIPPVFFQGYTTVGKDDEKNYVNFQKEKKEYVTATKELTWMFFGEEQIYVFKMSLDTADNALKSETTLEYFYQDVTAFASKSESVNEKMPEFSEGCGSKTVEYKNRTYEQEMFRVVVPGDDFSTALSVEDDNESKISAMKQKLRDKKQT